MLFVPYFPKYSQENMEQTNPNPNCDSIVGYSSVTVLTETSPEIDSVRDLILFFCFYK